MEWGAEWDVHTLTGPGGQSMEDLPLLVEGMINEKGRHTKCKYNTGKRFPCFFGTFQISLIRKV